MMRFKLHLWLLYLGLMVTGCASAPPQTVDVPVSTPCLGTIDQKPALPDTKAAIDGAENIAARVKLLLAGRVLRDKRIDNLEAAISGCQ